MSNKIEPLTQQHALEIANDWHYEAPYDFYDMKNDLEDYEEMISPIARGDRYYQVMREEKLYGFFCLEQKGERTFAEKVRAVDFCRKFWTLLWKILRPKS